MPSNKIEKALYTATATATVDSTTFGTPNDGTGWVDESARIKRQQAAFDAKSIGLYGQDLVQVAEHWKVLGGKLRVDVLAAYGRGPCRVDTEASVMATRSWIVAATRAVCDVAVKEGNLTPEQVRFAQTIYGAGNDLLNLKAWL